MNTPKPRGRRVLAALILVLTTLSLAARAWADEPKKYLIRHTFKDGRRLSYRLEVESKAEWHPQRKGRRWGVVDTDFTLDLRTKALRENGACTFDVKGKKLKSKLKGPKGSATIRASESSFKITSAKGTLRFKDNPLTKDMTATFGPRGAFLYGTKLFPVLPFLDVHVDRITWHALAVAPIQAVGKGDTFKADFDVHLPDSRGKKMSVEAKSRVTGWKKIGNHKCLVIRLEGQARLKETWVMMRNADRVRVNDAQYKVEGAAMWDVKRGMLVRVEAKATLMIEVDKPKREVLRTQARTKLSLIGYK